MMIGMTALQHRGQDAAGVITFKKQFHIKKGLGLVNKVFKQKHVDHLKGRIGVGHVRYTTQGSNESVNVQPIAANYPFGIAMVHNGNVTNFEEMRKVLYKEYHTLPATSNDLELILYTFASELSKKDLGDIQVADIFDAVKITQQKVVGSYSVIAVIANYGLLAFCDPNGIRPLCLGKRESPKGTFYGFASETTCFDHIGYESIRQLEAGEMVFIDKSFNVHTQTGHRKEQHFCVFEYIYFSRDDSVLHNRLVANERVKMGRQLGHKIRRAGLQPDVVIDVPSSGYFAASGLAEELGVPYRRGLVKNNHIGRSFISPTQSERENIVKRKLNPIRQVVNGKKVAVVDDSIVRGTTSKRIVQILKEAGATEVYFVSASPPVKSPCIYGIDMSISTELIAANKNLDEIREYMGADALIYQSLDDLKMLYHNLPTCMACLDGQYPTGDAKEVLETIEKERLASKD